MNMPPKELPTSVNGSGDVLKYLKENDVYFLDIFLVNLSDETRDKVFTLFSLLDKNRVNQLNRTDFTHPHPDVDEILGHVWKLFSIECSVYGNDSITLDELTKGLICPFTIYICTRM